MRGLACVNSVLSLEPKSIGLFFSLPLSFFSSGRGDKSPSQKSQGGTWGGHRIGARSAFRSIKWAACGHRSKRRGREGGNLRSSLERGGIYIYSGLFLCSLLSLSHTRTYLTYSLSLSRGRRREEESPQLSAICSPPWSMRS